jgi:hypothetical protein
MLMLITGALVIAGGFTLLPGRIMDTVASVLDCRAEESTASFPVSNWLAILLRPQTLTPEGAFVLDGRI